MLAFGGIKAKSSPRQLSRGFGLGLIVAITGLLVASLPFGQAWEEDFGLTWLFRLRGPVAPPKEVAIVSIDRESSHRLGLPDNPRKWPRDLHAQLLDRLTGQGASAVVFDVMFQDPRDPTQDRAFAESVRRAGNVVLFDLLKKETLPMTAEGTDEIVIEQRIPPIPSLAEAALGLAPFALPRVPIKVGQVWLFKPEAGEAATLPMVALLAHKPESYDRILALIRDLDPAAHGKLIRTSQQLGAHPRLDDKEQMLREIFQEDPPLLRRLLRHVEASDKPGVRSDRQLTALLAALGGPDSIHLNYYGPPRTIETLSYHRVLRGEPGQDPDIAGRVLFVGAAPRQQPDQRDGFYTPYTLTSGLDIGGVEIAATAFANLIDQSPITALAPARQAVLVLIWGLALGLGLPRFSGGWIPFVAAGAAGAYSTVAYTAFVQANLWLPLVTPLLAQLPTATIGALLWRYRDLHRERENIRHAFGMHLPLPVVDQLARGIEDFGTPTEHAYGICLATDAERYTALSERLAPGDLKRFLNGYYEALFPPVRSRGGVIADVVGDAMLAIWAADHDRPELRKAACEAALDILAAVDDFNRSDPEYQLPTRLGLHCGDLVLGHVGAVDHYEYRAVGDIVNTTSRIEGLCKQLGTRLLVSNEVAADLAGLQVRPLGQFLLKGKTKPLRIAELSTRAERDDNRHEKLFERFSEGLDAFVEGNLYGALKCFKAIEQEVGNDGPTAFYRRLCHRYLAEPRNREWSGVVRLSEK